MEIEQIENRWWEYNFGGLVYQAMDKSIIEVSLPHILEITVNPVVPGPKGELVRLFNSVSSLAGANYGNSVNITVKYVSTASQGIVFDYGQFLSTLLTDPINIGMVRVQSENTGQADRTLYLSRNVGVGKYEGGSIYPKVYPNQFISNISYIETPWLLDKFVGMSYFQNGFTNNKIRLYFYPYSNLSLDRIYKGVSIVKKYSKPQTQSMNLETLVVER